MLVNLDHETCTNRGNGRDNFTELELVQNSSFPSCIKTDHQNPHLFLPP